MKIENFMNRRKRITEKTPDWYQAIGYHFPSYFYINLRPSTYITPKYFVKPLRILG